MSHRVEYKGLVAFHDIPVDLFVVFDTWSFGKIGHAWGRNIRFTGKRGQVKKHWLGHEIYHAYELYGKSGIQKLWYWLKNARGMEARANANEHKVVLGQVPGIRVDPSVWTDYI